MGRLTKDYTDQWEQCSEEVQKSYGKEYILDGYIQISKDGAASSSYNIFPVIEGMTDALLAIKPKYRYRIGGMTGICDVFKVSVYVHRNTVEPLYNTVHYRRYEVYYNIDRCRIWIRLWTHKRHPIPRPYGRAMGCLLWVFWWKTIVL